MDNAKHHQAIAAPGFLSGLRQRCLRELPVFLFAFAFSGLIGMTGAANQERIVQSINQGLGMGLSGFIFFILILGLFWRFFGLKHSPSEVWTGTVPGRAAWVGIFFVALIAGHKLGTAYAAQAPYQLYALFWGLLLISTWSFGFQAGRVSSK